MICSQKKQKNHKKTQKVQSSTCKTVRMKKKSPILAMQRALNNRIQWYCDPMSQLANPNPPIPQSDNPPICLSSNSQLPNPKVPISLNPQAKNLYLSKTWDPKNFIFMFAKNVNVNILLSIFANKY